MTSSSRRLGSRRFSREPLQVREPDLDQRADGVLEPGFARDRERLLVRRPDLVHRDALLQPVVAGHEELLDPLAGVVGRHRKTVDGCYPGAAMLAVSAVFQVLISAAMVTLILMHSGREAGMGGLGFTPHSQGGTHIVERNLTRLTVAVAIVFGLNTVLLFHLL
jgi:preprotein translocase subunit SecG